MKKNAYVTCRTLCAHEDRLMLIIYYFLPIKISKIPTQYDWLSQTQLGFLLFVSFMFRIVQ